MWILIIVTGGLHSEYIKLLIRFWLNNQNNMPCNNEKNLWEEKDKNQNARLS